MGAIRQTYRKLGLIVEHRDGVLMNASLHRFAQHLFRENKMVPSGLPADVNKVISAKLIELFVHDMPSSKAAGTDVARPEAEEEQEITDVEKEDAAVKITDVEKEDAAVKITDVEKKDAAELDRPPPQKRVRRSTTTKRLRQAGRCVCVCASCVCMCEYVNEHLW